ncbi:MAG: hypothetical protein LC540_20200, partial [Candidatus Thiodiazotropha sp.]|nr:hypothetical protein [Candidatus Thiodiazotropha sp.]
YTINFLSKIPRVTELASKGNADVRNLYLVFSIAADVESEYRLAVRAETASEPAAADIRSSSATVVRKLSPDAINVLIGFHMDTDLFDADWESVAYKVGEGLVLSSKVLPAMLQANTAYVLYSVSLDDSDTTVHNLLEFTTDDDSSIPYGAYGPPDYPYTVRRNEPFLLLGMIGESSSFLKYSINDLLYVTIDNTAEDTIVEPDFNVASSLYFSTNSPSSLLIVPVLSKTLDSGQVLSQEVRVKIEHVAQAFTTTLVFQ